MGIYGFTGTQNGMTVPQAETVQRLMVELRAYDRAVEAMAFAVLDLRSPLSVWHHGDCEGADAQTHTFAEELKCMIHVHPPENPRKRAFCVPTMGYIHEPLPYFQRNRAIVEAARDGMIGAPRTEAEVLRSGTWGTIRWARKTGRKLWIVYPDGTLKEENMEAREVATRDR